MELGWLNDPRPRSNDYEVGLRHNLEQIWVLNDDGTMNELAGKYAGMDRYDCRKAVIKDLEALELLEKLKNTNIMSANATAAQPPWKP